MNSLLEASETKLRPGLSAAAPSCGEVPSSQPAAGDGTPLPAGSTACSRLQQVGLWGSGKRAWGLILSRLWADIQIMPSMGVDSKKLEYEYGGPFTEPFRGYIARLGPCLDALEYGCRMNCAGVPSFFGLGLEDKYVPSFWLLLEAKSWVAVEERELSYHD